jgi:hypothetical protein
MDWPIKQTLLTNNDSKRFFCGVNSYNIGRPLVQMVHFVSTVVMKVRANDIMSTEVFVICRYGLTSE